MPPVKPEAPQAPQAPQPYLKSPVQVSLPPPLGRVSVSGPFFLPHHHHYPICSDFCF